MGGDQKNRTSHNHNNAFNIYYKSKQCDSDKTQEVPYNKKIYNFNVLKYLKCN